jgi:sugar O-acyltransferase (sialic acid O-acetyltransferase NeuD family)
VKLLVYGASEFGGVVASILADCGHELAGFIDDLAAPRPGILGRFEEARQQYPAAAGFGVALAIGYRDLQARWNALQRVRQARYAMPALIHPEAYVHDPAGVGGGAIVMARAILDIRSRVGEASVVWPGANVSHDCVVGENSFLSPNSVLCGYVSLGRNCFVGAGAVVADHRTVPDGSWVKAGSVWS